MKVENPKAIKSRKILFQQIEEHKQDNSVHPHINELIGIHNSLYSDNIPFFEFSYPRMDGLLLSLLQAEQRGPDDWKIF